MSHRVHIQTDRTTNLLISSNVHYVYLGGAKYRISGKFHATYLISNFLLDFTFVLYCILYCFLTLTIAY